VESFAVMMLAVEVVAVGTIFVVQWAVGLAELLEAEAELLEV